MTHIEKPEAAPNPPGTTIARTSACELSVTRNFAFPARVVFAAWTNPDLFARWWVPKSCGLELLTCEIDARIGGQYRLVFSHPAAPEPMAFFGTYTDVTPPTRLVWTNEEAGENGQVTTITLEETAGQTRLVLTERYPTSAALDEAIAVGSSDGFAESFDQLDELCASR